MCRVYLLFTRLTLTSALWRMLGIQGGGHFSKHASKHNIFRRDAIVDRSERLLGKCRVLTRRNSAGLRIFHWGALVPSQYSCISHNSKWDFQQYLGFENPPWPIHLGTPSSLFGGMPPSAVSQASSYKTEESAFVKRVLFTYLSLCWEWVFSLPSQKKGDIFILNSNVLNLRQTWFL